MMTFEEKTSNLDELPRDDRYYILMRGEIIYQTDDVADCSEVLTMLVARWLDIHGAEAGRAVSFGDTDPGARTDVFHRPGVQAMFHPTPGAVPVMIAVGYGFTREEWMAHQPEVIKTGARTSVEEVEAEAEAAEARRLH